jgi:hypothetical protein
LDQNYFLTLRTDIISSYLHPAETNTDAKKLHNEWNDFSSDIKVNAGGPKKWGDIGAWFPVPKNDDKKKSPYEVVGDGYGKKEGDSKPGYGSAGADYKKDDHGKKDDYSKPDPVKALSADRVVRIVPFANGVPIYYLSSPQKGSSTSAYDKKPGYDNKPSDSSKPTGDGYAKSTSADPKSAPSAASDPSKGNVQTLTFNGNLNEGECLCLKNGSLVKNVPLPLVGTPQSPNANVPSKPIGKREEKERKKRREETMSEEGKG